MNWPDDVTVAVVRERPGYAATPPYPPSDAFPEWPQLTVGQEDNPAYRAVRLAFRHLGLDAERFGTPEWNPLADLLRPGDAVVLKPNFVSHRNLDPSAPDRAGTDCLVTHGSFVRAVLDYVAKGLRGRGRVIVGDCPIQGTSWSELVKLVGMNEVLDDVRRRHPGLDLSLRDYRLTHATLVAGQVVARRSRDADERAYAEVDLGRDSLLVPLMDGSVEFGVSQYPRHRMRRAHSQESNRYVIPRDFLDADVFINLPKMKGHQKAGITCALKNLVGVNGHKDFLPHFRFGSPTQGGDEYPDGNALWNLYWRLVHADWEVDGPAKLFWRAGAFACAQVLRRVMRMPRTAFAQGAGSWHGNDTLWRTVLDINQAFLRYDPARGGPGDTPTRRYLAVVDGLVGGQRESPLAPSPVAAGLVLAARNPLALDTVAAAMMGLDWRKLKQIAQGYELRRHPIASFAPEDISVRGCPGVERVDDIYARRAFVSFEPSVGWKGHLEWSQVSPPEARPAPGRENGNALRENTARG